MMMSARNEEKAYSKVSDYSFLGIFLRIILVVSLGSLVHSNVSNAWSKAKIKSLGRNGQIGDRDRFVAVVSSAGSPRECKVLLDLVRDWFLVIVPRPRCNEKMWSNWARNSSNRVFLSDETIRSLDFRISSHLHINHAFLLAASKSPDFVWETDCSLTPYRHEMKNITRMISSKAAFPSAPSFRFLNALPYFRPERHGTTERLPWLYPSALPPNQARAVHAKYSSRSSVRHSTTAFYANVLDGSVDSNGDHSTVSNLQEVRFRHKRIALGIKPGSLTFVPSKSYFWRGNALWAALKVPSGSRGHEEITRFYLLQRLLHSFDRNIAVLSTIGIYNLDENEKHSAERAKIHGLSLKRLMSALRVWKPPEGNAGKSVISLYKMLEDYQVTGKGSSKTAEMWVKALDDIGYRYGQVGKSRHVEVSNVEATSRVKKTPPNVALCVSGQVRTLTLPVSAESHPKGYCGMPKHMEPGFNLTVAQGIHRNLYSKLHDPDVFMVVSTREGAREPHAGDLSTCEPLRPRNGHLYCAVPKEERLPIFGKSKIWKHFWAVDRPGGDQGVLQQLKGLYDCYSAIHNHSMVTGKQYDWVIRLRPDDYVINFPDLETLARDSDEPTVWFGSRTVCNCGNEDTFGVVPPSAVHWYFERFFYLQQLQWPRGRIFWNPEEFLTDFLEMKGIKLRPHDDVKVCPLKPLNRTGISEP